MNKSYKNKVNKKLIIFLVLIGFSAIGMEEQYNAKLGGIQEALLIQKPAKLNIENSIGLYRPINDPHYIYINTDQLKRSDQYLYFRIYRMGKENILYWGVYNRATGDINIVGGCRYNKDPKILAPAIKSWKDNKFEYMFGENTNRSGQAFKLSFYFDNPKEYLKQKILIALLRGEITMDDYKKYEGTQREFDEFNKKLNQDVDNVLKKPLFFGASKEIVRDDILEDYEKNLERNLKDIESPEEFKHKGILFYNDYQKLKANIALFNKKIDEELYTSFYPLKVYTSFIKNIIKEYGQNNVGNYIKFLEDKVIKPYELELNRIDISSKIDINLLGELKIISKKIMEILSREDIPKGAVISNYCPNLDFCSNKNVENEACALYYYGIYIMHPNDIG